MRTDSEIIQIIDETIKSVWVDKIKRDYDENWIMNEDGLKNALYFHLRKQLEAILLANNLRIFTEFKDAEFQGKQYRPDMVIAHVDMESDADYWRQAVTNCVAVIELKFATVSSSVYGAAGKITIALDALADLLPSVISILIGFTVMFITLLLISETPAINDLKAETTENKVHGKYITLYQKLHIQLTESLFSEIILLLIIFAYLFYKGIGSSVAFETVILVIEAYLTLHILLGIIRSMTHLYCVYYGNTKK